MTGDWAARSTNTVGDFTDAGAIAHLLGQHSDALGSVFAIVLMDASIIGAAAVTLATSYAFGDVFGLKHSLHRGFADAKQFYLSYTAMVVLAAAHRADSRRPARVDHHRRAGPRRSTAAQRQRVSAAAVQRPGSVWGPG